MFYCLNFRLVAKFGEWEAGRDFRNRREKRLLTMDQINKANRCYTIQIFYKEVIIVCTVHPLLYYIYEDNWNTLY